MPITQKDIARAVGVSQTVVSDVLQGRPRGRVSPNTREQILETARRLGYRPNASAQALRSRVAHQAVYVSPRKAINGAPILEERVVAGVADTLSLQDYRLLLEIAPDTARMPGILAERVAAGTCDGGLLRVTAEEEPFWSSLHALDAPFVVIGQCPDPTLPSVAHDAEGMIVTALQQLSLRGHREVALVLGGSKGDYFRLIRRTWAETAPKLGIDPQRWRVESTVRRDAHRQVLPWLTAGGGPTAVVCLHEQAAVGVTDALRDAGRQVGRDFELYVVGSVTSAWLYEPGTWFFGTDLTAIGRRAAEMFLGILSGTGEKKPVRLLPELLRIGEEDSAPSLAPRTGEAPPVEAATLRR